MADFPPRALAWALLMLMAAPADAQEIRVFSEGKPFVVTEAGRSAFAAVKDERRPRQPLRERSDAAAIAAAHAAAFLHCGLSEAGYPPPKPAAPEEIDYFVKDASFIPIAGTNKIILIGEYLRGKAIVDLDQHTVLTPQCPAAVRTMFWSYSTERVVFASQQVTGMTFYGDSRSLWTARFNPAQDLFYVDSVHGDGRFHKLLTLPDEKVLDVLLPENADHLWVLSQSERIDLRNPRTWLRAISGTPALKMDIRLRKVDLHGVTLETVEVARAVPSASAHFLRE